MDPDTYPPDWFEPALPPSSLIVIMVVMQYLAIRSLPFRMAERPGGVVVHTHEGTINYRIAVVRENEVICAGMVPTHVLLALSLMWHTPCPLPLVTFT